MAKPELRRVLEWIFWRLDIPLVHYLASPDSGNPACQRAAFGPPRNLRFVGLPACLVDRIKRPRQGLRST